MSENIGTYIKKATPSSCCVGYWSGMQDTTDGRTTIVDGSTNARHLIIGAGGTYSAVVGTNAGYATIVGAAAGTDKSLATADNFIWDMYAGQSMIGAVTIKAANPGTTAWVFNARGATGDVKGCGLAVDGSGKPIVYVRDTGTTFATTAPTEVVADSTDHQIIWAIDGTGKKVYIWRDGTAVSNTGQTVTATAGSTQGDGPARWGGAGDFVAASQPTWVNGANLLLNRMHLYVMPYWPANIANIVAELARNPHRPLPARMLPATASV